MKKAKFWQTKANWEEAEKAWDTGAKKAQTEHPLKMLKTLPNMPGITKGTAKNLKWKSLKYMVLFDKEGKIRKHFLKHPFKYGWRYLKSLLQKESFKREQDFFYYGIEDVAGFKKLLKEDDNIVVIGFSYCHKPFECPSGRFTDACIHDSDNAVCRQCYIGKCVNSLPERKDVIPLFIPTVHYIGEKMFEISHANPEKQLLFMITACELTLKMFSDWGNMIGCKGIGIRLDGRICNTMKAFELSEEGTKPGLTVVLKETQEKILDLIKNHLHK